MWRCDYCRARFEDRDSGINHARARHSRDYTACRPVRDSDVGSASAPRLGARLRLNWTFGMLPHLAVALVLVAIRQGT